MENRETVAELRERLRAAENAERQEREAYKALVNETVEMLVPKILDLSQELSRVKNEVYESFANILEMKAELYGIKSSQQTHTFSALDGSRSITIGHRVTESYDDTVDVGVEKVKTYLATLAKDSDSASLVDTVMRLLAKDRQGNLRASRVVELEQIAVQSNNQSFLEGIKIIKEAYKPKKSCRFVEVIVRGEDGKEKSVPLSISAVE